MPKDINSYTHPLNHNQVNELRGILEQENYEFKSRDYAIFSAKKDKLNVTVYEKGPKVLGQGKGTGTELSKIDESSCILFSSFFRLLLVPHQGARRVWGIKAIAFEAVSHSQGNPAASAAPPTYFGLEAFACQSLGYGARSGPDRAKPARVAGVA